MSLPQGTKVIIEPRKEYTIEDIVFAYISDSNQVTLKKLVKDSGIHYLKSLNPAYPMIELTNNIKIMGTAVQTITDI